MRGRRKHPEHVAKRVLLNSTMPSFLPYISSLPPQALVKEPALSDGRLQPGDKLLAANGVELASFSHQVRSPDVL